MPAETAHVQLKEAQSDKPVVLPTAVRAAIWEEAIKDSAVLSGRVCVLCDEEVGSVEWMVGFQRRVARLAERQGVEVKWVTVCGPEYVRRNVTPEFVHQDCTEIAIADVARNAGFRGYGSGERRGMRLLWRLNGCGGWREVDPTSELGLVVSMCFGMLANLVGWIGEHEVWVCKLVEGTGDTQKTVWFMPRDGNAPWTVSSTAIRNTIRTVPKDQLQQVLRGRGVALAPDRLAEYLQQVE